DVLDIDVEVYSRPLRLRRYVPTFRSYRVRHFFFYGPPTTQIYTLSLHDALPISHAERSSPSLFRAKVWRHVFSVLQGWCQNATRSEEHTSELQSPYDIVCRLLLEKK